MKVIKSYDLGILTRLHYDLVMCYKIVFNIVNFKFCDFFVLNIYSATRGHPYKLYANHW